MFKRRLGFPVEASKCSGGYSCPDVLELASGDYAIIGTDITHQAQGLLPQGSGCSPAERIVQIPRALLIHARAEIPAAL